MDEFSDQEKIDFFNTNWEHLKRIFNILQTEKLGYIRAGKNLLEWLADWMENVERNK